MDTSNLALYLNDHLAGAIAGIEMVEHLLSGTGGTPLGDWLAVFRGELEEDRETVRRILRAMDRREDPLKKMGGWAMEKFAKAGMWTLAGHSVPLQRMVELEALLVGTHGRCAMWRVLEKTASGDPRVDSFNFAFLRERAEKQVIELERFRVEQAALAFGP